MKLSTIAKMITESKLPQYTDIINIAKTTALGHDSILWSPSKQQFTVKKNIIGREVPKQFATEFTKNLNSALAKNNFSGKVKILATKKDKTSDDLILNFVIE